jgi:hypothetical protein
MTSWCGPKILDEIKLAGVFSCMLINGGKVHKFKIRPSSDTKKEELAELLKRHSGELEIIVRAAIANSDLEEFFSDHFLVSVTKAKWHVCDKLDFFQKGQVLKSSKFSLTLSFQCLQEVRRNHVKNSSLAVSQGPNHKILPTKLPASVSVSSHRDMLGNGDGCRDKRIGNGMKRKHSNGENISQKDSCSNGPGAGLANMANKQCRNTVPVAAGMAGVQEAEGKIIGFGGKRSDASQSLGEHEKAGDTGGKSGEGHRVKDIESLRASEKFKNRRELGGKSYVRDAKTHDRSCERQSPLLVANYGGNVISPRPARRKFQDCGAHECTPKKQVMPRQRDRFRIDSEELCEAMKLQAYAKPTFTSDYSPEILKQDDSLKNVLIDVMMTPLKHVKKLFH